MSKIIQGQFELKYIDTFNINDTRLTNWELASDCHEFAVTCTKCKSFIGYIRYSCSDCKLSSIRIFEVCNSHISNIYKYDYCNKCDVYGC